jgi:hypothetical protein
VLRLDSSAPLEASSLRFCPRSARPVKRPREFKDAPVASRRP